MRENIRKIVAAAERPGLQVRRVPHPCRALVLEARVGDDKGQPCPCLWSSHAAPPPPQNVAKSVAKARKNTQVTTSQHQPHQQHTRDFTQKHPLPPLFDKNEHRTWLSHADYRAKILRAIRPEKLAHGKWMTVAEVNQFDWMATDSEGRLDMEEILSRLALAGGILSAAVKRRIDHDIWQAKAWTRYGRQFELRSVSPHSEISSKNRACLCPAFGDEACRHQLFLMSASKAKPPFGSRVALNASRGDTWYCPWMVWLCVEATFVENVTKRFPVTRC